MPLTTDLLECHLAVRRIQVSRHYFKLSCRFVLCEMCAKKLSRANCYFAHDFSVFPYTCGVASLQALTSDLESLPSTIAQSARVGPDPRRLDSALGASNSSARFRNR
jgi:hypothetical protein